MPPKKSEKKIEEEVLLISTDPNIPRPRLAKLIIKNFRCIGSRGVEIDLDDIVVLVGPNNVGKSSILKAYQIVMSHGSSEGKLEIQDFPGNKIDPDNLPEIELQTIVFDKTPGERWITITPDDEMLVRERWIWSGVGDPKRQGWDVPNNTWSDKVPWGAPNVAKTRRPIPHRVDAFDSPEKQAEAIKKLLKQTLEERVKTLKNTGEGENDYKKLLDQVKDLQKKIVTEAQDEIDKINNELSTIIDKVFPGYIIDFDAKPEDNLDKTINLFKEDANLLMGLKGDYLSTIDRQGSGARRTLLWVALKFISEDNQKTKSDDISKRPHLLLIDEPEICLHPSAIRDSCNVLYELPNSGNWQVMITTHSPIFIDFSRDNTTIIRVDKDHTGKITGTTVFRPNKFRLDDDDKNNLKLLNLCDPYVAEFFFGGKNIIVEGDTEYTAFNYIIKKKPEDYKNIHIIRARGKATIISLIKILNHFGCDYSILHDSDLPTIKTEDGERTNGAWTLNKSILSAISTKPASVSVRLLASLPNFEKAFFQKEVTTEKPYNALKVIESDQDKFKVVEDLLKSLINSTDLVPEGCINWDNIEDLEQALNL